jgi:hypothetical protein
MAWVADIYLKAGCDQILMKDPHETAFSFENFGLKNAPTMFQRLMDEVLEGLDENWCQIYTDDMIFFSRDESLRTSLQ